MADEKIIKEDDDDEVNPPTTTGTVPTTGTAASAPARKRPEGSGRFIGLQKYLQAAGKPSEPSQTLGGKIGGRITERATGVREGIQAAKGQFQEQVGGEQQRLADAPQAIQGILGRATTGTVSQPSTEDIQRFQQFQRGQYQQPVVQTGRLAEAGRQAADVQQMARLAQTEPGRFQLLRQMFGQPQYTRGQTRLDQLLLQTQQGGLGQLQQAARGAQRDIGREQAAAEAMIGQELGALGVQARQAQRAAERGLAGRQYETQQDILQREAQEEFQRGQLYDIIQRGLAGEEVEWTPEMMERFRAAGYDPSLQVYGYRPELQERSLLPIDIAREQVATPEERARLEALGALAGREQAFLGQPGELETLQPFALQPEQMAQVAQQRQAETKRILPEYTQPIGRAADMFTEYFPGRNPQAQISMQDIERDLPAIKADFARYVASAGPDTPYARRARADIQKMEQMLNQFGSQYTLGGILGMPSDVEQFPTVT